MGSAVAVFSQQQAYHFNYHSWGEFSGPELFRYERDQLPADDYTYQRCTF